MSLTQSFPRIPSWCITSPTALFKCLWYHCLSGCFNITGKHQNYSFWKKMERMGPFHSQPILQSRIDLINASTENSKSLAQLSFLPQKHEHVILRIMSVLISCQLIDCEVRSYCYINLHFSDYYRFFPLWISVTLWIKATYLYLYQYLSLYFWMLLISIFKMHYHSMHMEIGGELLGVLSRTQVIALAASTYLIDLPLFLSKLYLHFREIF